MPKCRNAEIAKSLFRPNTITWNDPIDFLSITLFKPKKPLNLSKKSFHSFSSVQFSSLAADEKRLLLTGGIERTNERERVGEWMDVSMMVHSTVGESQDDGDELHAV